MNMAFFTITRQGQAQWQPKLNQSNQTMPYQPNLSETKAFLKFCNGLNVGKSILNSPIT